MPSVLLVGCDPVVRFRTTSAVMAIPIKLLLIVVYTAAVAAGALGVGYAVVEWGDEDRGAEDDVDQETLDERIVQLADSLLERIDRCPNELSQLIRLVGQALIGQISGSDLERELRVLGGQYLACAATALAVEGSGHEAS